MTFSANNAEIFIPDGRPEADALARTTDLCIAAHQDDIEIMAYGPIVACYDDKNRFFTGCVVSDGAGSPRSGLYADYTDEQMKEVRVQEQKNAASVGNYSAQVFFKLPSSVIKDSANLATVEDIEKLLLATNPETVYTHNLADKHDTHVAVALRTIEALRRLPADKRPKKVYCLEVWRGLDWMCDSDKVIFNTSDHPALAAALLGVFDSQIAGGKRYDSAALGRRLANATFFTATETDDCESMAYGLDITDLVMDESVTATAFIQRYLDRFSNEVAERIRKFQ